MKVGFLIYPRMQLMDLVGPLEVFEMWRHLNPQLENYLIAENSERIPCGVGVELEPHFTFMNAPDLDLLIVPGGYGRLEQVTNPSVIKFIQRQARCCQKIAAVCTGAFLLQAAGILIDKAVTTYWRALPELALDSSLTIAEERIVRSGKIWSSGGVSSGIDLALALIADLAGSQVAGKVQLMFEYFPSQQVYDVSPDLNDLPDYPHEAEGEERRLPRYIQEYLQSQ